MHDRTVSDDYYAAMARIEQSLVPKTLQPQPADGQARGQLLKIARQLVQPRLAQSTRKDLYKQIRRMIKTDLSQQPAA